MTTPSVPAGATLFAEAIRVTKLDVNGVPIWGASSCVQAKNVVSLAYTYEMQAGVDLTKTDGKGEVCLTFKGRDTKKRINVTLNVCDEDLLMKELLVGGTLFTATDARTVTDGVTTSSDATVTSALANFTSADIGAAVTGAGIPANTTILSLNSESSVELSASATATATGVSLTITGPPQVVGYQSTKVGEVGRPFGVSVEVWAKHVVGDIPVGYEYHAFPRIYFNDNEKTIGPDFADMSFVGYGNENANWGSGPMHSFDHDSTSLNQHIFVDELPSPLADGYITISAV